MLNYSRDEKEGTYRHGEGGGGAPDLSYCYVGHWEGVRE